MEKSERAIRAGVQQRGSVAKKIGGSICVSLPALLFDPANRIAYLSSFLYAFRCLPALSLSIFIIIIIFIFLLL